MLPPKVGSNDPCAPAAHFPCHSCRQERLPTFQSRCCLNDIDQRLSQNDVPLSRGHVVRILSVVYTVELEAR